MTYGSIFRTLVVATIALAGASCPLFAGDKEAVTLRGLTGKVEVWLDVHGMPHIYAHSWTDATRTLGYLHATDRLGEMDLFRRQGSGTMAEVRGKDGAIGRHSRAQIGDPARLRGVLEFRPIVASFETSSKPMRTASTKGLLRCATRICRWCSKLSATTRSPGPRSTAWCSASTWPGTSPARTTTCGSASWRETGRRPPSNNSGHSRGHTKSPRLPLSLIVPRSPERSRTHPRRRPGLRRGLHSMQWESLAWRGRAFRQQQLGGRRDEDRLRKADPVQRSAPGFPPAVHLVRLPSVRGRQKPGRSHAFRAGRRSSSATPTITPGASPTCRPTRSITSSKRCDPSDPLSLQACRPMEEGGAEDGEHPGARRGGACVDRRIHRTRADRLAGKGGPSAMPWTGLGPTANMSDLVHGASDKSEGVPEGPGPA